MFPSCRTPLHLACRWGRVGAIRELVAAGADVNKPTSDGRTPGELLKVEMEEGARNEIVKLLGEYRPLKLSKSWNLGGIRSAPTLNTAQL